MEKVLLVGGTVHNYIIIHYNDKGVGTYKSLTSKTPWYGWLHPKTIIRKAAALIEHPRVGWEVSFGIGTEYCSIGLGSPRLYSQSARPCEKGQQ